MEIAEKACDLYDKELKIFRESPGFFVDRQHSSNFVKIVDNIGLKNNSIIRAFGEYKTRVIFNKMDNLNANEIEKPILFEWISQI